MLTLKNGEPRRECGNVRNLCCCPEIVEDFDREVYGRIPQQVPKVTWTVTETRDATFGDVAAVEKQLEWKVDNSACPTIEVKISMTVTTPKNAPGRVPVLMMFGGFGFGPPRGGRGGPPAAPPRGFCPLAHRVRKRSSKPDGICDVGHPTLFWCDNGADSGAR